MTVMACSLVENIAVAVHSTEPPTDDEWIKWIELNVDAAERGVLKAMLVVTDGGAPNAKQRSMVADMPDAAREVPTAIVSHSTFVRGIVTALSWSGKNIKAFDPASWDRIGAYLKVEQQQQSVLLSAVRNLQREVGVKPHRMISSVR